MRHRLHLILASLTAVAGLTLIGVSYAPAHAAPSPPRQAEKAVPMTAEQQDTLKKGGVVISEKRLDVAAAPGPPCAPDEFHNVPNSEAPIRVSAGGVWTWVPQGRYFYGQLTKLYVQTGMDTYIFDWNSSGNPVNGATLHNTGWYELVRWRNCGVRTVGETWPQ